MTQKDVKAELEKLKKEIEDLLDQVMRENYENSRRIKELEVRTIDPRYHHILEGYTRTTTSLGVQEFRDKAAKVCKALDLDPGRVGFIMVNADTEQVIVEEYKEGNDSEPTQNSAPRGAKLITDERFLKQVCRSCPDFHDCNWIHPTCPMWKAWKKGHPK